MQFAFESACLNFRLFTDACNRLHFITFNINLISEL
jgi:hypothetical protein